MTRFKRITREEILGNEGLKAFLLRTVIEPSLRGDGVFLGSKDEGLAAYGIILPRGGMIIPGESYEYLQELKEELEKKDLEVAELRQVGFFCELVDLAAELPHIEIHETPRGLSIKRGGEEVRDSMGNKIVSSPEDAIKFLKKEGEIWRERQKLMPKVSALAEMLGKNHGESWWVQALQWGVDSPYFSIPYRGDAWITSHSIGLVIKSGWDGGLVEYSNAFQWSEDDISSLVKIVEAWVEKTRARMRSLLDAYRASNREVMVKEVSEAFYGRRSFTPPTRGYEGDSWTERRYSIGDQRITEKEKDWLLAQS